MYPVETAISFQHKIVKNVGIGNSTTPTDTTTSTLFRSGQFEQSSLGQSGFFMGLFLCFGLDPLVQIEGNYELYFRQRVSDFVADCVSCFKHGDAQSQVHKENGFPSFCVEERDWSAQIPDLNPVQHLWDELECRL